MFMTMSLARGLTTLNTRKRKPKKFTLKQQEKNEIDRRAYNKRMKQLGLHNQQMNSEEYEQYLLGNYKSKKKEKGLKLPKINCSLPIIAKKDE